MDDRGREKVIGGVGGAWIGEGREGMDTVVGSVAAKTAGACADWLEGVGAYRQPPFQVCGMATHFATLSHLLCLTLPPLPTWLPPTTTREQGKTA